MNINVTTQNAADCREISRTASTSDQRTYFLALSNAANHGVALINRLGATEATDEITELRDHYLPLAEAAREAGDVEADAFNRGKFAGYHAALTD
jgi:hypothetical protein